MITIAVISVLTLIFSILNFLILIPVVKIAVDLKEVHRQTPSESVPERESGLLDLPQALSYHTPPRDDLV
jgi:hypothetical protein